jgi:glycosyltransferase involved in cell wall biosynthesis
MKGSFLIYFFAKLTKWAIPCGPPVCSKNLIFIPADDHIMMAQKIISLAHDRKKIMQIGNEAFCLAKNFTWDKSNEILENFFIKS